MTRSLVASVDGNACAQAALPVALALAEIEEATLHVVQSGGLSPRELIGHAPERAHSVVLHDASGEQASGDRARAVLGLAAREDARAIVLCTRGATDPPQHALGEHAREVLASARCPVVLVREAPPSPWALEEVLLPHDGSPATSAAIGPAAAFARRAHAKLLALHVATPGARAGAPGSLPAPRYLDQPQHDWPEWAGEFLERLESCSPLDPSDVRLFLGLGEPGSEVLRVADEQGADLIVLAWHGDLAPAHADVFKALLRSAPCPMMVLRVPAPRARAARGPRFEERAAG